MIDADVILLHGLSRTPQIMAKMAQHLSSQGYRVYNLGYPSTQYSIEILTDQIAEQIAALRAGSSDRRLNFVAHSLGALITHLYIKKYAPSNLARVVALSPPYRGTALADHLAKYRWYRAKFGPVALELTTQAQGIGHRLGPADYELGVIAGDRHYFWDWFFAHYWLRQPNDGKVEVASTYIPGCRDHIILPVNHVRQPKYPIVIEQTAYFLSHGVFLHT